MSSRPKDRHSRQAREDSSIIPERYKHIAAFAGLVLALVVFLFPVIYGGKTFLGPDSIASHSFDTLLKDAKEQGVFPLWNPYIFGGMPAFGSLTVTGDRWYDFSWYLYGLVSKVVQLLLAQSPSAWVVFHYIVFGMGIYLLAWKRLHNALASYIGAFGVLFSMYIIIWVIVSHNTKIATISTFPYLLFFADRLREKFSLIWSVLAVLAFHFMFNPSHVQMIYYSGLALGVYLLFLAVDDIRKKEKLLQVLRPAIVLGIAAVFAFAMDADRYLSVFEYNPYSIRGAAPILQSSASGETKTVDGGLDYEYATQWSLGVGEVMTFFVPTWYGFGHLTYDGPLSREPFSFNAYWGPQTFTDGAQYMGVVLLILAGIGFWKNRGDLFVRYLAVMVVFSVFVAFGSEFPVVYDLLFAYLPFFNKFRIPSMILVLVQIFIPILAAYGVHSLMEERMRALPDAIAKRWKRVLIALAAAIPALLVLRSPFESFYKDLFPLQEVGGKIARQFGQVQSHVIAEIYEFVVDTVVMDVVFALIFLVVALGVLHAYRLGKLSINILGAVLIGVVCADLWRIDMRNMNPEPRSNQEAVFTMPPYVEAIKRDSTMYRTLMFQNRQPPYDNTMAYWRVESAYGYQGAKMRSYQDMIDVAGTDNPLFWQLMNVKYIISNTPDSSLMLELYAPGNPFSVYRFRNALPRAFFVDRIEQASGAAILNSIANRSFDPGNVAYSMEAVPEGIEPAGEGASVDVTEKGIQHLELRIVATGRNAVFLSEVWYPEGWRATLDGASIPILRLNYLFRGIVVPPGEHVVRMVFEPSGFAVGKTASLGVNIVVLVLMAFVGFREYRARVHRTSPAD